MKPMNLFTLLCVLLLPACGMVEASKNYIYGVGEKMPTYGDDRCDEGSFCFGGSKNQRQRSPSPAPVQPTPQPQASQQPSYNGYAPQNQPQASYSPPQQPANSYTGATNHYPAQPYQPASPAQKSSPYYGTSPQAYGTYQAPQQPAAYTPPANWDPAGIKASGKAPAAPGQPQGNAADAAFNNVRAQAGLKPLAADPIGKPMKQSQALKPYEENPIWKHKLDETFANELMRSLNYENDAMQ